MCTSTYAVRAMIALAANFVMRAVPRCPLRHGPQRFTMIGPTLRDLPLWRCAENAIVVSFVYVRRHRSIGRAEVGFTSVAVNLPVGVLRRFLMTGFRTTSRVVSVAVTRVDATVRSALACSAAGMLAAVARTAAIAIHLLVFTLMTPFSTRQSDT